MNAKKCFFLCCLFFFSFFGYAQSYSFVKTLDVDIWKIIPAQNGTFYTITWRPDCPEDLITLNYFNAQGDIVKSFQSPPYIGSLTSIDGVVNASNHIVIYLRDETLNHLVYEFDSNGNMIWNNGIQFTNPIIKYTKIILSPTGYYLLGNTVVAAGVDSTFAVITKLSNIGKHQWTKKYNTMPFASSETFFHDLLYLNHSLVCVGGYVSTNQWSGQPPYRPIVSVLDTAGNVQQSYCYTIDSSAFFGFDYYKFVQISKTPNGSFYLVGNNGGNEHALFKMNSNFQIQWIRERLSGRANAMCAGFEENVFIVPDGNFNNFVMSFDSTGQVKGNHITKNPSTGYDLSFGKVMSISQHDCGFLLKNNYAMYAHVTPRFEYSLDSTMSSGFGNYYPVNNFNRRTLPIYAKPLTQFNQYTLTTPYAAVTHTAITHAIVTYNCNNVTANEAETHLKVDVYPNPADTYLHIDLSAAIEEVQISLFDLNGKNVWSQKVKNQSLFSLDVVDFPSGLYVLHIQDEHHSSIQKIHITH